MLGTGLQVMILGMGIVFLFLALLVLVMTATAAVFRRFAPEGLTAAGIAVRRPDDATGVRLASAAVSGADLRARAAAIAAVTHFRRATHTTNRSTEEHQ